MDRPPPDPTKMLNEWMEWERGEVTPGRVMANLKTAGLRDPDPEKRPCHCATVIVNYNTSDAQQCSQPETRSDSLHRPKGETT